MAFEDLRERLQETAQTQWAQIQGTETFQQLKSQYENLAPNIQLLVRVGGSLLVLLLLFSVPYVWYSSSRTAISEFEDSRSLLKQALSVANQLKSSPEAIPQLSSTEVKTRVDGVINSLGLVREQISSVSETSFSSPPGSTLVPRQFVQNGAEVKLSKLNLRQVMDLTYKLQTMPEGTKVIGLEFQRTAGETHYYDVTARVVSFNVQSSASGSSHESPGSLAPTPGGS